MKKNTFLASLVIVPILVALFILIGWFPKHNNISSDGGIEFETKGWQQALSNAKKEKKFVFLDAYTSWCGPCKLLKRTTFKDKNVRSFFNENFINITMDMEKGEGITLAKKYQVRAFPTLLIIDSEENVIASVIGYLPPDLLIDFGKHALIEGKMK